ncbi:hypothetical protein NQ318_008057 [Aromia moschata]|uniref:Mos1 transposase HTH domain-containing protein n=1 Tax=Aromia moschata TaxID=1265417 RepID=A0AAV8XC20_9CUCU|nr:hypothetical protein NQ318_008057 [Aromia moschata]
MQRSLEQRMAIKFCVKLEKSVAETIPVLKKAFGVDCLSERQIFRWHKAFAEGREDFNDENRAGPPSTSSSEDNVKRVRDLLKTDRRLSVRLISETLDITKTIVHEIESLGMRKVCAKLVPKVLTGDQKQHAEDGSPASNLATTASTINHGLIGHFNWILSACLRLFKQAHMEREIDCLTRDGTRV